MPDPTLRCVARLLLLAKAGAVLAEEIMNTDNNRSMNHRIDEIRKRLVTQRRIRRTDHLMRPGLITETTTTERLVITAWLPKTCLPAKG
jgi:uncharacterized membrane protein